MRRKLIERQAWFLCRSKRGVMMEEAKEEEEKKEKWDGEERKAEFEVKRKKE